MSIRIGRRLLRARHVHNRNVGKGLRLSQRRCSQQSKSQQGSKNPHDVLHFVRKLEIRQTNAASQEYSFRHVARMALRALWSKGKRSLLFMGIISEPALF